MPELKSVRNIDAIARKAHGDHRDEEYDYAVVDLFDEKLRVRKAINIMNLLAIGDDRDSAAVVRAMTLMLHDDDQRAFRNAYARQPSLTADELMTYLSNMVEVAADENPTGTSSGSRRITAKRTGKQLSAPASD